MFVQKNVLVVVAGHARRHVGQQALGRLEQVVAQEEAAKRMLNAATHLDEIAQDDLARVLFDLDVNGADGDEQVPW